MFNAPCGSDYTSYGVLEPIANQIIEPTVIQLQVEALELQITSGGGHYGDFIDPIDESNTFYCYEGEGTDCTTLIWPGYCAHGAGNQPIAPGVTIAYGSLAAPGCMISGTPTANGTYDEIIYYANAFGVWGAWHIQVVVGSPGIRVLKSESDLNALTDLLLAPTVATATGMNETINPTQLYVGCLDSSGNPIQQACPLEVTVISDPGSGGHVHDMGDPSRPPGELALATSSFNFVDLDGVLENPDGFGLPTAGVPLKVSPTGNVAPFYYLASPIGGEVNLKVHCSNPTLALADQTVKIHIRTQTATTCQDPTYSNVAGVYALCPLLEPAGGYFRLTGQITGKHIDNHNGTAGFNAYLDNVAQRWYGLAATNYGQAPIILSQSNPKPLAINDMSLIDGGLFDVDSFWKPTLRGGNAASCSVPPVTTSTNWCGFGHKNHRSGRAADIGSGNTPSDPGSVSAPNPFAYWVPPQNRLLLRQLLLDSHHTIVTERSSPIGVCNPLLNVQSPCTHWHVQEIGTN